MKTAPAYMLYASDLMADRRYRMMSLSERGLMLSMMNECWVNRSVPSNPEELARLLGTHISDVETNLTERVLSFFNKQVNELIHPEIEKYREEILERRRKQSAGGKKGVSNKLKNLQQSDLSVGIPQRLHASLPRGYVKGPRVELIGDELKKNESINNDDSIVDKWVSDYDSVD